MRWIALGLAFINFYLLTQPAELWQLFLNGFFGIWCLILFLSGPRTKQTTRETSPPQYPDHIRKQFPGPWTE